MGIYGTNGNDDITNTSGKALDVMTSVQPLAATIPTWFNDQIYMGNKAAECGLSGSALTNAFEQAGFYGESGDFLHFVQYGQWEDVSPVASFDAGYYYQSKAAEFYNVKLSEVTSAQTQSMKDAIHNAGMNAWSHYQQYGTREGIDAIAGFDTSAYMEAKLAQMQKSDSGYTMDQLYDAFEAAGLSAAAHYEAYGKAEGLKPVSVPVSENPSTPSVPEKPSTPSEPEKPSTPSEPEKPSTPSEPETPSTPAHDPVNYTATTQTDYVYFHDGVADTFTTTRFGTPGVHAVQTLDLSSYEFSAFSYLRVNGYTLWSAVGSGIQAVQTVDGWTKTMNSSSSMTFTANSEGPQSPLIAKFSYEGYKDFPNSNGGHTSRYLNVVEEGSDTVASTSSLQLGVYADTIYGFNPSEDHISLPVAVNSLVKGGALTALSEAAAHVGANQAGLFKYGSDYYLYVNDANPAYDAEVDITIKLAGLSDADAASMTADIFV